MKNLTISDAVSAVNGKYIGDAALLDTVITGVKKDNREINPGNIFVCIKGERVDGHDYANAAFSAGAVCCLCEKELASPDGAYILVDSTTEALRRLASYYRSTLTIPIIGVIGSVGKTTAKEMLAAVLSAGFSTYKTPKNLNNDIGVPLSLLEIGEEHEIAVIEMGISDFGEMRVLAEMVRPDVCVMTSIGYCHLENLGDLSGVLRAKSEVFEYMSESGLAVVNGDDEMLRAFTPKTRKLMFGYGKHNDIIAENVNNLGADGIDCNILSEAGSFSVHVPGYGRHLILSVLPAVLVGRHFGMADEKIIEGIGAYKAIDGRSNVIDTGYIRIIDDCYNANPHSMTSAILSLAGLEGRHVAILGDMKELGRLSQELHREIGEFAGKNGVDSLICCGDLANFIYKGLIASGSEIEAWQFPMMDSLLSVLPSLIHEGDTVLVKASHSMDFGQITEALKKLR